MTAVPEITVQELKELIDEGQAPVLIDVREPAEHAASRLESTLVPLGELPLRVDEIEPHREEDLVVVYCRSGARSARAVQFLQAHGFTNARNLRGGLLAWQREIDPSMPTP
ncbi:MAG: rhodanese-like domain-containing protein [Rhodothermales bacterium]|nr:rhodanese-like domain-containing protein [Rhodothermales bacterium]